ncbi:hypothetical protein G6F45_014155 [Rhizopus arrhizus]|nr:hypothetical protein G6F45_014155 [Rhizopus arrhizus]
MCWPAANRWPFLKTGCSFARLSSEVSGRLPSSRAKVINWADVWPVARSVTSMTAASGTISSSKRPAACAAAVRCCERNAYASCAARGMP